LTGKKISANMKKNQKGGYEMPVRILGEKYYLTEDLVDMLPIGLKTLQMYIRIGKLPGRRIGKFYYVSQASLKNFLKGRDKIAIKEEKV
jgi:hypothetical protein